MKLRPFVPFRVGQGSETIPPASPPTKTSATIPSTHPFTIVHPILCLIPSPLHSSSAIPTSSPFVAIRTVWVYFPFSHSITHAPLPSAVQSTPAIHVALADWNHSLLQGTCPPLRVCFTTPYLSLDYDCSCRSSPTSSKRHYIEEHPVAHHCTCLPPAFCTPLYAVRAAKDASHVHSARRRPLKEQETITTKSCNHKSCQSRRFMRLRGRRADPRPHTFQLLTEPTHELLVMASDLPGSQSGTP